MKKTLALLLAIAMIAVMLVGCAPANNNDAEENNPSNPTTPSTPEDEEKTPSEAPVVDDTRKSTANSDERLDKIVWEVPTDPKSLLPYDLNGSSKKPIVNILYESLFVLDGEEYIPELAKSYTIVDDLHWDVEIWDTIYDHKGNHITAEDVVYSYNWLTSNGYQIQYSMYEGIEAVGEYTVRFTWNKPIDSVRELEGPWTMTVVFSQKSFEEYDFSVEPVGTGPYCITEYTTGAKVVAEAYDDYWQKEETPLSLYKKQNVQTIEFIVFSDETQMVTALQTGSIDIARDINGENVTPFDEGGQYSDTYDVYDDLSSDQVIWMVYNQEEGKVTSDINLRLAIAYAIDNAMWEESVVPSYTAHGLGTPKSPDYNPLWDEQENYINVCDLELAKQYLEKSSYKGEELVMKYSNSAVPAGTPEAVQSMLGQIGINVTLEPRAQGVAIREILDAEGWDLFLYAQGGSYVVTLWNALLNNTENGNGKAMGFIVDDTLQSMFELCRTTAGHTTENMDALHDYVVENCYFMPLSYRREKIVYNSDKFATLILDENNLVWLNACDYYLD